MNKTILCLLSLMILAFSIPPQAIALTFDMLSTQSGNSDEIISIKADAAVYHLAKGETLNLKDHLLAFCSNEQLCQNEAADYEFEMEDPNLTFSLNQETGEICADEERGTATITIKANEGKVSVIIKVTADPEIRNAKDVFKKATGYRFEKQNYEIPVGESASDAIIKIVSIPDKAIFTPAQKEAIEKDIFLTISDKNGNTANGIGNWNLDTEYQIRFQQSDLKQLTEGTYQNPINKNNQIVVGVNFPRNNIALDDVETGKNTTFIKKTLSLKTVKAINAKKVLSTGKTITIEVGETRNISDLFKVSPANANVNWNLTYSTDYFDNEAAYNDYAIVNSSGDILGVAVGKNKIIAALSDSTASAFINVDVVPVGTVYTEKIKLDNESPMVGDMFTATLEDTTEAEITWKIDDTTIAEITHSKKMSVSISAKKAGIVALEAYQGSTLLERRLFAIKPADSDFNETSIIQPTGNPQTGDSLFSNLF